MQNPEERAHLNAPLPGLFYLMEMVRGVVWLSAPDVPVTVNVT
jgi:hypothetical protein